MEVVYGYVGGAERSKVRAVARSDMEIAMEIRGEQMERLRTDEWLSLEAMEEFYDMKVSNRGTDVRLWWGAPACLFGFVNIQWCNRTGEISYLSRSFTPGLVRWLFWQGFEVMNLETITAEVYDTNPEKGLWAATFRDLNTDPVILKKRKYWDGKYWDSKLYILDKQDWKNSTVDGND